MPKEFEDLVSTIQKLPGIGPKAASRIALYIVTENKDLGNQLISDIHEGLHSLSICKLCGNISDLNKICSICIDSKRDRSKVAMVFSIPDLLAIEKTQSYNGLYFIFNHAESIFDQKDKFDEQITKMFNFLNHFNTDKKETIFAFPHTIDSEIISSLITEKLQENFKNIDISQIAFGMPSGADFDYTDKLTIIKSFKGRNSLLNR